MEWLQLVNHYILNPLEFLVKITPHKLQRWGYRTVKISYPNFSRFSMIHPYDGHTHGGATAYSMLSIILSVLKIEKMTP